MAVLMMRSTRVRRFSTSLDADDGIGHRIERLRASEKLQGRCYGAASTVVKKGGNTFDTRVTLLRLRLGNSDMTANLIYLRLAMSITKR